MSFSAALAAEYIEQQETITTLDVSVLEDAILRAYCIIGSIVGAWITLSMYSSKLTVAQFITKFIASMGTGVMLTPMILYYTNLPKKVDIIAGVSTLVAIFALAVLATLTPTVTKWAESFFKR